MASMKMVKEEKFWNDMDKTLDSVGNGYSAFWEI